MEDLKNDVFAVIVIGLLTIVFLCAILFRSNTMDDRQQRIEHKVDKIEHAIEGQHR